MESPAKKMRIAAVGDLHVRDTDKGRWTEYFRQISGEADVLVICGDLTDTGDESEAHILADELNACTIPVIAVLGNHDFEKGRHKLIRQIVQSENVHVLDGEAVVIDGIGFAGVKGFGGGFEKYMLSLFGEEAMKAFVQEGIREAMNLDRALARLDALSKDVRKIAVLHYSPVKATVVGEPEPLFPFLGTSLLEEPLNRRKVSVALHGHAHSGAFEGKTSGGASVYNVSKPVLDAAGHDTGYFIFEV